MSILNPEPGEFGKILQEKKQKAEQAKAKDNPPLYNIKPEGTPLLEADWASLKQQALKKLGKVLPQDFEQTGEGVVTGTQAMENAHAGLPISPGGIYRPVPERPVQGNPFDTTSPGSPANLPAVAPAPAFGCSDHGLNPGFVCCQCGEYVDHHGNTASDVRYCQYPECSCIVTGNDCAKKLIEGI